ncbi:MAG: anti-sigma factor, partial [Bacteroidota bacterium]
RTHCEQMTSSLNEIRAEQQQFATDYAGIQSQLDSVQRAIAVMSDRDFTKVVMAGTDNAPESHATIFWNASTSQLYLIVGSLKALAADQQYQLWAIVDGNPVDAGVFDLDGDYLMAMKEISGNAATFAVTIEPLGGSEGPSLETMQVAGNL